MGVNLAANQATVEVAAATGEKVSVTYRPGALTGEWFAREGTLQENLPDLLISWDLYENEETKEPYPIDTDHLNKLPSPFVSAIYRVILEDQSPGKGSLNGSGSS